METFDRLRLEVMDDVQILLEDKTLAEGKSVLELMQISLERLGCKDEFENNLGSIIGMNLFEVGRLTNLPTVFLEEFSWMPWSGSGISGCRGVQRLATADFADIQTPLYKAH